MKPGVVILTDRLVPMQMLLFHRVRYSSNGRNDNSVYVLAFLQCDHCGKAIRADPNNK